MPGGATLLLKQSGLAALLNTNMSHSETIRDDAIPQLPGIALRHSHLPLVER